MNVHRSATLKEPSLLIALEKSPSARNGLFLLAVNSPSLLDADMLVDVDVDDKKVGTSKFRDG